MQHLGNGFNRLRRIEGPAPGQALEQDGPEQERIGSGINRSLLDLLGREVPRRADNRVGTSKSRYGRRRRTNRGKPFGDAEVQELGQPGGRQHDVLRLQIAMDDRVLVGRSSTSVIRVQSRRDSRGVRAPRTSREASVSPSMYCMTMY